MQPCCCPAATATNQHERLNADARHATNESLVPEYAGDELPVATYAIDERQYADATMPQHGPSDGPDGDHDEREHAGDCWDGRWHEQNGREPGSPGRALDHGTGDGHDGPDDGRNDGLHGKCHEHADARVQPGR